MSLLEPARRDPSHVSLNMLAFRPNLVYRHENWFLLVDHHSKWMSTVQHVIHAVYMQNYTTFSCYVFAAMLEGKNNTFSLPWNFTQNSALQHGFHENPL